MPLMTADQVADMNRILQGFARSWARETDKQIHDRIAYGTWNPERYQKEKTSMKPGPYKSSTHGDIPLSIRGRELLMNLRDATTVKIAEAARTRNQYVWKQGDSLSHFRGELAKYMSELEANQKKRSAWPDSINLVNVQNIESRGTALGGMRHVAIYRSSGSIDSYYVEPYEFDDLVKRWTEFRHAKNQAAIEKARNDHRDAMMLAMEAAPLIKIPGDFFHLGIDFASPDQPKEKIVTEETPKTRLELLGAATQELLSAQQELEYIEAAPADAAEKLYISLQGAGILASGIQTLVREQFDALRKKVTARAKARVAKAEKAVQELLGG